MLVQHQEPDVPAPLASVAAAARAGAPPSPRCRRPSAGGGRFRPDSPRSRQDSVGPCLDRMPQCHALAQRSPDLGTFALVEPGEPAETVREALRRVALEEQRIAVDSSSSNTGFDASTGRHAAAASYTTLSGAPASHVVDEDDQSEANSSGTCARGTASPSGTPRRSSSLRCRRSSSLSATPCSADVDAFDLLDGTRGSSRGPSPANSARARARRSARRLRRARCSRIRSRRYRARSAVTFGDAQRKRARDRRSTIAVASLLRQHADVRGRLPVRVPEHERRSPRPHERRGEHGVEREHVRDDHVRPGSACASSRSNRQKRAARDVGAPNSRTRDVRRAARRRPRLREHDELVDALGERADLRRRSPPRTGSRGRRFCVSEDQPLASEEVEVAEREPPGSRSGSSSPRRAACR